MAIQGFSEKDWKLFRSRIADWQENYMDRLCQEYADILSGDGNASDKFWKLEERIKKDKKKSGVQCQMSRSEMMYIIMELLNDEAITMDDLDDFSDDFKETIWMLTERRIGR